MRCVDVGGTKWYSDSDGSIDVAVWFAKKIGDEVGSRIKNA